MLDNVRILWYNSYSGKDSYMSYTDEEYDYELLIDVFGEDGFSYIGNIYNQNYHPTGGEDERYYDK
jgi:hypothetical protein